MRTFVLLAAMLAVSACSGGSEQKTADPSPTEETAPAESAEATDAPAAAEEAEEPAAEEPKMDLAAVEDLSTLFTVTGNVDKDQVAGIIGQRKPDIYDCYSKVLEANPGLAGRVLVKITATSAGDVASAIVQQSTIKNPELQQCMTKRMRGWKFPNDDSGGLIVVQYAFQLPP